MVSGAARHGVPAEYIRTLEAVPADGDSDPGRAETERQFLRAKPWGRPVLRLAE
jgi:hypothetical protein